MNDDEECFSILTTHHIFKISLTKTAIIQFILWRDYNMGGEVIHRVHTPM